MKDLYLEFYTELIKNIEKINQHVGLSSIKTITVPVSKKNTNQSNNYKHVGLDNIHFIDPEVLSNYVWGSMRNIKPAKQIFEYISDNNLSPFKKVTFEDDLLRSHSITKNFIADFVRRVYELSDYKLGFNMTAIEKAYSELEKFLSEEKFEYKLLVNIHDPIGEIDEITFGNAKIKKADYQISKLFCLHYPVEGLIKFEMLENDYFLEIELNAKKEDFNKLIEKERIVLNKIFNVLVLSNIGNIEHGNLLRMSYAWPLIKTERISYRLKNNFLDKKEVFKYKIDNKFESVLQNNYRALNRINYQLLDGKIQSSLKRLEKSKSTSSIEDKITELVLSIEYLINTSTYEVTLQLCLKMIKLYCFENQNDSIFKLLKDFFKLRGDVFHGNKQVLPTERNIILVQKIEEIIQNILIKYIILNQKYTLKEINQAVDKSLYINMSIDAILKIEE